MNDQQRADLDAWFAEADDVLDNWRPGLDAMVAPASREPVDGPLPRGDSYYDQPRHVDRWEPPGEWPTLEQVDLRPYLDQLRQSAVAALGAANVSRISSDTLTVTIDLSPPSAPRLDVQ